MEQPNRSQTQTAPSNILSQVHIAQRKRPNLGLMRKKVQALSPG